MKHMTLPMLAVALLLAACTQEQQNKISRDIQNWTGTNGVMEVYAGDKLVRRFDANRYLYIGKAMELHDVGRGRNGLPAALARAAMPALVMGISSDILYPEYQQRLIADLLPDARYAPIDSPHGHDAFLLSKDQVSDAIGPFLDAMEGASARRCVAVLFERPAASTAEPF